MDGRADFSEDCRLSPQVCLVPAAQDTMGLVWSFYVLGWTYYARGDLGRGDEQMRSALATNQAFGNPTATAHIQFGLAYGAFLAANPEAQRAHLIDALTAVRDDGGLLDMTDWLGAGAVLAATEGRYDSALRIVGGAGALRRRHGSRLPKQLGARTMAAFEPISATVDEKRAAELIAEGEHMDWNELIAVALTPPPHSASSPTSDRSSVPTRHSHQQTRPSLLDRPGGPP